ncbi:MAG: hypothetical protein NT133_26965 [Alphaproteobacteria bacterium]|nr:hypothetical protein [Alphaproteobacteria bacterium]
MGVLLLPTIGLFMLDHTQGKPAARPMLLCGIATIVAPTLAWWSAGPDLATALAIAGQPERLAFSWSMQGLAWLGIEALPAMVRLVLDGTAATRVASLRRARAELEKEWTVPPSSPGPTLPS